MIKFSIGLTQNEYDILRLKLHNYPETKSDFIITEVHRDMDINKELFFIEGEVSTLNQLFIIGKWIGYFDRDYEETFGKKDYKLSLSHTQENKN